MDKYFTSRQHVCDFELRLLHFADSDPERQRQSEDREKKDSSSTKGLTEKRAKLLREKEETQTKDLSDIDEAHKDRKEKLDEVANEFLGDEDDEVKEKRLLGAERGAVDNHLSDMQSIAGEVGDSKDKLARHFLGEQLDRYVTHSRELLGPKYLEKHEQTDEQRLRSTDRKHAARFAKAAQTYNTDFNAVQSDKDSISKADQKDDSKEITKKVELFKKVAGSYKTMNADLTELKKDQFGFGKVKQWSDQIVDQSEKIFNSVKDVKLESTFVGAAEELGQSLSGTGAEDATEEVEKAVSAAKKDPSKNKEAIDVYATQMQGLTEELQEWYEELEGSTRVSTDQVHKRAKAIIDAMKICKKKMEGIKENPDVVAEYQKQKAAYKKQLDDEFAKLQKKHASLSSSSSSSSIQEGFREQAEEILIKRIEEARGFMNHPIEGIWPFNNYNPDAVQHFSKEKTKLVLDHVAKINKEFLLDPSAKRTDPLKPDTDSQKKKPSDKRPDRKKTIDSKDVPHSKDIDRLVALHKAGDTDSKEYKNLKNDLIKKYKKANPEDQEKMRRYLDQLGYTFNPATGALTPKRRTADSKGERGSSGSLEGDLRDALGKDWEFLAPFLVAVSKLFDKMGKPKAQPGQGLMAPNDPRIANIQKQIGTIEKALEKFQSGLSKATQHADPRINQQLQQLQNLYNQLQQMLQQQQQTQQQGQQLQYLLFPMGTYQIVCMDGCYCIPGMPLTLFKWHAQQCGCPAYCIDQCCTMVNGCAAFTMECSVQLCQSPQQVYCYMGGQYECSYNQHNYQANPQNAQSHFNNSYRKAMSNFAQQGGRGVNVGVGRNGVNVGVNGPRGNVNVQAGRGGANVQAGPQAPTQAPQQAPGAQPQQAPAQTPQGPVPLSQLTQNQGKKPPQNPSKPERNNLAV